MKRVCARQSRRLGVDGRDPEKWQRIPRALATGGFGEADIWLPPHEPRYLREEPDARQVRLCPGRQYLLGAVLFMAEAIPQTQGARMRQV